MSQEFDLFERQWHGYVGYTLTGKDGTYCGHIGQAYPCDSQEDGWQKGIKWLRTFRPLDTFLIKSFQLDVKYF